MGFQEMGIAVYRDAEHENIRPVVEAFAAGKLPRMQADQACKGGGGHCQH